MTSCCLCYTNHPYHIRLCYLRVAYPTPPNRRHSTYRWFVLRSAGVDKMPQRTIFLPLPLSLSLSLSIYIYTCIYIYIYIYAYVYIYIYIEREIERDISLSIYLYIYLSIYIYIYVSRPRAARPAAGPRRSRRPSGR